MSKTIFHIAQIYPSIIDIGGISNTPAGRNFRALGHEEYKSKLMPGQRPERISTNIAGDIFWIDFLCQAYGPLPFWLNSESTNNESFFSSFVISALCFQHAYLLWAVTIGGNLQTLRIGFDVSYRDSKSEVGRPNGGVPIPKPLGSRRLL